MKRWEFFFETEGSHARTVRAIATNIEKARLLAIDHLGTDKFHEITVQTFFEAGCEFHTIEEQAPVRPYDPHAEMKAAEAKIFSKSERRSDRSPQFREDIKRWYCL